MGGLASHDYPTDGWVANRTVDFLSQSTRLGHFRGAGAGVFRAFSVDQLGPRTVNRSTSGNLRSWLMCSDGGMDLPTYSTLRIERVAGQQLATLVLNRPECLNALSRVLLSELAKACQWLNDQHDIKVLVVRGEGRAFSAGFDLGDFKGGAEEISPRDSADLGRVAAEALTGVRQLTIASIHGHCVGGGLVLAASCDLRVAADDTYFSIPEVDLGIPLAWGGVPRLTRELGPAITKELILTCRQFSATEAKAVRFLNRIVPLPELDQVVEELAHELAEKPGFAIRSTKQQVNAVMEEIAGTGRSANDADTLAAALSDPESRAASVRYLESRSTNYG